MFASKHSQYCETESRLVAAKGDDFNNAQRGTDLFQALGLFAFAPQCVCLGRDPGLEGVGVLLQNLGYRTVAVVSTLWNIEAVRALATEAEEFCREALAVQLQTQALLAVTDGPPAPW